MRAKATSRRSRRKRLSPTHRYPGSRRSPTETTHSRWVHGTPRPADRPLRTTDRDRAVRRLVEQVMSTEPLRPRSACVLDRRERLLTPRPALDRAPTGRVARPRARAPASWLSQIEIVFSVIRRKVLTPNVVASLQAVFDRLDAFEPHCNQIAKPFESNFARRTGGIPLRTGMSRDLLYRPRSPSRVLSDMSRMGSRNPGTAKYSGGVQSPQSVVLCSDVVESGQTRVDAQIAPGSSNGVRVSPSS